MEMLHYRSLVSKQLYASLRCLRVLIIDSWLYSYKEQHDEYVPIIVYIAHQLYILPMWVVLNYCVCMYTDLYVHLFLDLYVFIIHEK